MQLFRRWAILSILNLLILSAIGILLRYKIVFPLPAVEHKNLLHGHSHFAFAAWVSLALFTGIVSVMQVYGGNSNRKYNLLFWLAQIAGFGMLLTFPFMGYKLPSIAFSTLSVFFSYLFCYFAWKQMDRSPIPKYLLYYFRAALFFYVFSSIGTFTLAWLMATHTGGQAWYIGSVYFYLHFQYNGWFLFGLLGLFFYQVHQGGIALVQRNAIQLFWWLFASCVPAFFLSALWMELPSWMHWLASLAAIAQLIALIQFWMLIGKHRTKISAALLPVTRWLWLLASIAFTLKFIMQALSAIPTLSYLAFGFRPIVIGYLHLILLGMVTLFLIGYLFQQRLLAYNKGLVRSGILMFTVGVVLNESLLMIQGIFAISYTGIPSTNYYLLAVAVLMFAGLLMLFLGQRQNWNTVDNPG